jgi:hypothetical protein
MMMGVMAMTAGGMGMMGGDLMIVLLIMFRRFAMVARCFFVMFSGAVVMGAGGMLVRHGELSFS